MFAKTRAISKRIRELRLSRGWTQSELAAKLELSQSRLSELERGAGSFTAEQFIEVLRLFNVTVRDFDPVPDSESDVQQALARHGAKHLIEPDSIVPTEQLADVHDAIAQAIASGSPRLMTGLAPVIIANIDRVSLAHIELALGRVGLSHRFNWVIENTRTAVASNRSGRARRSVLVLDTHLDHVPVASIGQTDVLDRSIRSEKTLQHVRENSSEISKRWGIVTDLQPADFDEALKASGVLDP